MEITVPHILSIISALMVGLMAVMKFVFTSVIDLGKVQIKMGTEIGELKGEHRAIEALAKSTMEIVREAAKSSCEGCLAEEARKADAATADDKAIQDGASKKNKEMKGE